MTTRQQLLQYLRAHSVLHGNFTLASGQTSDYYIDVRLSSMSGAGMVLIGQVCLAAIDVAGWQPDLVGGMTLAADPVAYAIANEATRRDRRLDAFVVRKEPKGHGAKRQIEGPYYEGADIVVIEDVVTTGGSTLKAIEVLLAARAKIQGVLVLVDREQGGMEVLRAAGYQATAIFSSAELLAT